MKVIFLDIDGVLNNSTLLYHYGSEFIDGDMTELLFEIVRSTGARVVLSSSWRLYKSSKKLVEDALGVYGIEILDVTPHMPRMRRCREISRWLKSNAGVEEYAILDDDPDAGPGMEDNFFMTDSEKGLDMKIAKAVIKHLGSTS
jgi:hypothetical protein